MDQLIVISGPIGSGKSTLASHLAEEYGAFVVHTRRHLRDDADQVLSRAELQTVGEELDRLRGGTWVVEAVMSDLESGPEVSIVVVDAARTHDQVESLRTAFGRSVVHIHLDAPAPLLEERYESRRKESPQLEFSSFDEARQNQTEASIGELERDADIVVDTERCRPGDVLVRVASRVGLLGPRHSAIVDVMVGGQFGSEGKGNVAAYLAPEYDLLVRSGGPNAGHSVWKPDGTQVQHHLPSGTTESQAMILLTAGAVIHPGELLREVDKSHVGPERLRIDPGAMIIDEDHRRREGELTKEIGSTGSGVGAATADRIMRRSNPPLLAQDVPELRPYISPAREILHEHYRQGADIFVEGTQGTGLSLLHGPYPHVTSRDTTASGILAEAGIPPKRVRRVVLVVRTYPIRVANPEEGKGTSGPLFKELTWEEISERSGLDLDELKRQEHTTRTKRLRRVGEFDWDQLALSSMLNGPTDIALTFTDQLDSKNMSSRRFDQLTAPTIQFIEEVERVAGAPVSLISTRFHQRSVIDRRSW